MKIINYIFAVLAFTFVLTGCSSNENELASVATTKVEEGYVVNDGYIKFKNQSEYRALYEKLSSASDLELSIWSNNLPFKSLESKYKKDNINTYVFEESLNDDLNFKLNTKRVNAVLAALYNENGVMVINDTILKIKDEYLFTITNGDFDLLDKIENDIDYKSDNITKQNHTIKLFPAKNTNSVGMQKTITDRSNMVYVSTKRREFVTFEAEISGGYVNFYLKGHWQSKFLGVWLTPSSDEFNSGQINISGHMGLGYDVYKIGEIAYGVKEKKEQVWFGEIIPSFVLNVTYNHNKTGSSAGVFTKTYVPLLF